MTVLAQAWVHHPDVRHLIAAALRHDLGGLTLPAAQTAIQTRPELGSVLAEALADVPASLTTLMGIAEALPYPSVVLAQADVAVTSRVRQMLPAGSEPQTVARWADRAGMRLAAAGRPTEALQLTQEAVNIYRDLDAASPDSTAPTSPAPSTTWPCGYGSSDTPQTHCRSPGKQWAFTRSWQVSARTATAPTSPAPSITSASGSRSWESRWKRCRSPRKPSLSAGNSRRRTLVSATTILPRPWAIWAFGSPS